MDIDQRTLARARSALREAAGGYLYDPNVNLIDLGYPEHGGQISFGELAIRIHVHQKLHGAMLEAAVETGQTQWIPATIGGFPTDVPQGSYRLQQQPGWFGAWPRRSSPRAGRFDPLRGGISISSAGRSGYGTLGGLVRDRASGAPMILSNWHVLSNSWGPPRAHAIYQPGWTDNGTGAEMVATFSRDGMARNLDAAVALLNGRRQAINDAVELGPVRGLGQVQLGLEVVKSGRRTGVTYGLVTAIEGTARIDYGSQARVIRHVVSIEPRSRFEEVSAPGDSGSWWLAARSREAIGLHFAGSNAPERGLAIDMAAVLEALSIDLVTDVRQQWRAPARRTWRGLGHVF